MNFMKLPRAISKTICRGLVGVVLFAQLAVASYACPVLARLTSPSNGDAATALGVAPVQVSTAESTEMAPGCDQMDAGSANLCAEHCRFGQQSADTAPAPVVHAAIPTLLYSLPLEPQPRLGSGRSFPASDASLAAAPPPPHAILHCVFRI